MKDYNEIAGSVLARRNEFDENRRIKKKTTVRILGFAGCFVILAALVVGVWQSDILEAVPLTQISTNTSQTAYDENKGQSSSVNNKIIINSVDSLSSKRMNIALMWDDFVEMTQEELIAYYGVNFIPSVPEDMVAWEEGASGIFKREGGTGEVYWDANILNYSNENSTRNVHLEVDKGNYVYQFCFYFKGTEEKSFINNTEVLIGLTESGYYYAEFMYKGVGFLLSANGVTEEEFVTIISSVIK